MYVIAYSIYNVITLHNNKHMYCCQVLRYLIYIC